MADNRTINATCFAICHESLLTNILDSDQTDINLNTTVFAGKLSGVTKMSKYSDDEFVEFIPVSDLITDMNHAKPVTNSSNETNTNTDMTLQNQQPIDQSEEETNCYASDMLPQDDNTRFQIRYTILRDQLPPIIVFHCSGKLVESNCLVLHNTFKMCNAKNLSFIIFDLTDVVAVEKEVWAYFSSKVAKLQKLNGILLFAGIRSDVLSETSDFNKLNICHCDTIATCCLAIRNLTHDHEKTDSCMIFDEDDSSFETQSNIHDFLYNEKPTSELPEMKLVDSLLNRKKNEVKSEKLKDENKEAINSSAQLPDKTNYSPFEQTILINNDSSNPIADAKRKVIDELKSSTESVKLNTDNKDTIELTAQSQPQPDLSPFDKTILINDDDYNPVADARRKVMAKLKGKLEPEIADTDIRKATVSQPQSEPGFSPFEQTILINDDGSNPVADARRKVIAELKGKLEPEIADTDIRKTAVSQPQSEPGFSPFEQTILINDDGSNPVADARRKVIAELKGKSEPEIADTDIRKTTVSVSQPQSEPGFSPFEQTILINDDGSNPVADARRKVIAELKGDKGSKTVDVESRGTVAQPRPELSPIEKVNLNNPGLFEKTILLDDENGSSILDAKKKILEELGKGQKKEAGNEKRDVKRKKTNMFSSQPQSLEKTVLINDSVINQNTETKIKGLQETGNDRDCKTEVTSEKRDTGIKEKVDFSAQSPSQPQPQSKPVVSDKSQTLSLKDLYIDDSMSTDYSIVDKSKEEPLEDTDGEMLPLIDESQSIDFSQNDKTVMSQSATVDISRSSLGLSKTNISLKNITPSDPYSVHYGVYEKNGENKNQALPAGKITNEKLTAQELVFKVIADYGPVNILQLKNHINEKLDKKNRINTLKLFTLLRQVDLDTHEKRVRYYRSC